MKCVVCGGRGTTLAAAYSGTTTIEVWCESCGGTGTAPSRTAHIEFKVRPGEFKKEAP